MGYVRVQIAQAFALGLAVLILSGCNLTPFEQASITEPQSIRSDQTIPSSPIVRTPVSVISPSIIGRRRDKGPQSLIGAPPDGNYCAYLNSDQISEQDGECGDEGGIYNLENCSCNEGEPGGGGGGGGGGGPIVDQTPFVSSITPASWYAGTTTQVTISGAYFGTNQPTLSFSPSAGISYTLTSYSDFGIVANITVANGTPTEAVSVSVTSTGFFGNPFYGGPGTSPTGTGSGMADVVQPPGTLYVVDPYQPGLAGSTNLTTSSLISAIDSGYENVAATGLITDGEATAVAVYENPLNLPVSFSGSGGLTFETYDPGFLGYPAAAGSDLCPSDTCSVTTVASEGSTYSFVLVQAPEETYATQYGQRTTDIDASVSEVNSTLATLGLEPTPVVFVHGLWGSATSLSTVSSTLAASTPWNSPYQSNYYEVLDTNFCYSPSLPFDASTDTLPAAGSGCEYTSQGRLNNEVTAILSSLDTQGLVGGRVDIVAHSMGGLAARNFANPTANSTYSSVRSRMQGLFRTVVTIDTPENGSALAPFLLQSNIAGGTCSNNPPAGACSLDPETGLAITPQGLLWNAACATLNLASCLSGIGNPLGPPSSGVTGFNINLCPGSGNASTPPGAPPNCGAVASLTPGGYNILALPPSPKIPGSQWFAIGSDWHDDNVVPCVSGDCSILRNLLNEMLVAIQSQQYLTAVLVSWDNDVIVTTSSQTWGDGGVNYAEYTNLAHSAIPGLPNNAIKYLTGEDNSSVLTSPGVSNCVVSILMTLSTSFCLNDGATVVGGISNPFHPDKTELALLEHGQSFANRSVATDFSTFPVRPVLSIDGRMQNGQNGLIHVGPCQDRTSCLNGSATNRSELAMASFQNGPDDIKSPIAVPSESPEETTERLKHPFTSAPQRLSVIAPKDSVPLGSPVDIDVTFAPGKLAKLNVTQYKMRGNARLGLSQGGGSYKIVREDGQTKILEFTPVQLGTVNLDVGAVYSDNGFADQTIKINVVPSSKGVTRFAIDGGSRGDAIVMGDEDRDRQKELQPSISYSGVRFPIIPDDMTAIKFSVEQDENNPVIRIDPNGMVHALREGTAYIDGDFDGITDRVKFTIFDKSDAPAGYHVPQR
jgi:pimeloyl-ACP methyl ester carboxylesterase